MESTVVNVFHSLKVYVNGRLITDFQEAEDAFVFNIVGREAKVDVNSFGSQAVGISNSRKVELTIRVLQGSKDDMYLDGLCQLFFNTGTLVNVTFVHGSPLLEGSLPQAAFLSQPSRQLGTGNHYKEYSLSGLGDGL